MLVLLAFTPIFGGCSSESNVEEDVIVDRIMETSDIIYVDVNNSVIGDGTTWESAYQSLEDALNAATKGYQIWVAQGTYVPQKATGFQMIDGIDVYGSFNGDESSVSERVLEDHLTILSGQLNDQENATHVVIAANAVIDGFTITNGGNIGAKNVESSKQAPLQKVGNKQETSQNESKNNAGHSSPEEVMEGNASTSGNGAGMIIWGTSTEVRNCIITQNSAGKGGGVYVIATNELETLPSFINCEISDNYAVGRGGGVSLDMGGDAIFIDCVFDGNTCDEKGGAIYNDFGCSPMFENCLFINNSALYAGAIGNDGVSNSKLSNCTFYGNTANEVGAVLYQGTGPFNDPSMVNSIIWGNTCDGDAVSVYNWNESNPKIEYSIIEGGYTGTGNLAEDPMFVDAENNNFDLSKDSVGQSKGQDGSSIGYKKALVGNRTDEDIQIIIENLYNIELNEEPIVVDRTNPITENLIGDRNIIYVSEGSNGNGSSWNNALADIQEAINYANGKYMVDGSFVEVWVSSGIYYTGDSRSDSIVLREGVYVYGGFEGTEATKEERSIEENITILSGDIGVENDSTDNSYHVVIGSDYALIDGFTISDGYADGKQVYDTKGGGMLNYLAGNRVVPHYTPTLAFDTIVSNCEFINNYAVEGGAVYSYHGGKPVFENCNFVSNSANYGGAVVDRGGMNTTFTNCDFISNSAVYKGGATFIDYGSMEIFYTCNFEDNTAGTSGGGIYLIDRASQAITNETSFGLIDANWSDMSDIFSCVYIKNSTFDGNTASKTGSAIYAFDSSNIKVVTSEFNNNTSTSGGAISKDSKSSLIIDAKTSFSNNSPLDIEQ
jgi:predicted outer membrane repeat protein